MTLVAIELWALNSQTVRMEGGYWTAVFLPVASSLFAAHEVPLCSFLFLCGLYSFVSNSVVCFTSKFAVVLNYMGKLTVTWVVINYS